MFSLNFRMNININILLNIKKIRLNVIYQNYYLINKDIL